MLYLQKYYIKKILFIAKRLFLSQYFLMLEYRAEITLWALSGILPLIMLGLWIGTDSFVESNIDRSSLIQYFIAVFILRQFTAVWVMISFEEDQLEGKLSPFLLQPICPFWRYYFSHIAEQVSRLPIVIIMLTFLFLFFPDGYWIPSLPLFLLSIVFIFWAFSIRFLLHWCFS